MRSPHTSYRWRGEIVIEPIKCMRSPHTSYSWRGERVIETIKWMGMIKRPWLTRTSGGNLARTPGLHPLLFTRSAMGFWMTTESQDLGLTFHPKDSAQYCHKRADGSLCFWIALAALWCHTLIILCSAATSRTHLLTLTLHKLLQCHSRLHFPLHWLYTQLQPIKHTL